MWHFRRSAFRAHTSSLPSYLFLLLQESCAPSQMTIFLKKQKAFVNIVLSWLPKRPFFCVLLLRNFSCPVKNQSNFIWNGPWIILSPRSLHCMWVCSLLDPNTTSSIALTVCIPSITWRVTVTPFFYSRFYEDSTVSSFVFIKNRAYYRTFSQ